MLTLVSIANTWQIKSSVYRGKAPIVEDLFVFTGTEINRSIKSLLKKPIKTDIVNGWVSSQTLLKNSIGINTNISGQIWLEICQPINSKLLEKKVINDVSSRLLHDGIKIERVTIPSTLDICLLDDLNNYQIELANTRYLGGNTRFLLHSEQSERRSFNADMAIKVFAPIAKSSLVSGQSISLLKTDFSWISVEKFNIADLIKTKEYLGILTKAVRTGDVLSYKNFREKSLIERGQKVLVKVKQAGFTIESEAKALSRGNKGDLIDVIVNNAHQSVKGRVENKGVVSVQVL